MGRFLFAVLSLFAAIFAALGQAVPETETATTTSVSVQTSTGVATILPAPAVPVAAWEAKPRSIHETVFSRVMLSTNNGRIVTNRTSYTAVGNGLNFKDPVTGEFRESSPEFVVTADGLGLESRNAAVQRSTCNFQVRQPSCGAASRNRWLVAQSRCDSICRCGDSALPVT